MWSVVLVEEVDDWFIDLVKSGNESEDAEVIQIVESVTAAINMLEADGPSLSRPIADRIKGSTHHNMKELRPSGTSVRILFIFDPERQAVLLVAGDKAGDWKGWYETNIPIADQRYQKWLQGGYD